MIAANGVTARFLEREEVPVASAAWSARRSGGTASRRSPRSSASSCRPIPTPRRWRQFLVRRRKADPLRFPDLSLAIVKAMGAGEYVARAARAGRRSATSAWR